MQKDREVGTDYFLGVRLVDDVQTTREVTLLCLILEARLVDDVQ